MGLGIFGIIIVIFVIPPIVVEFIDVKKPEVQSSEPTYQDRINAKYNTVRDCENVNEYSLAEVRERCTGLLTELQRTYDYTP